MELILFLCVTVPFGEYFWACYALGLKNGIVDAFSHFQMKIRDPGPLTQENSDKLPAGL